jgi:hypothetical protein
MAKIEMVEYTATIVVSVLVPRYNASPGIEKDMAENVVAAFLRNGSGDADVLTRSDLNEAWRKEWPIDADDEYEVDCKRIYVELEKSPGLRIQNRFRDAYGSSDDAN